jgi:hypothetical protein
MFKTKQYETSFAAQTPNLVPEFLGLFASATGRLDHWSTGFGLCLLWLLLLLTVPSLVENLLLLLLWLEALLLLLLLLLTVS